MWEDGYRVCTVYRFGSASRKPGSNAAESRDAGWTRQVQLISNRVVNDASVSEIPPNLLQRMSLSTLEAYLGTYLLVVQSTERFLCLLLTCANFLEFYSVLENHLVECIKLGQAGKGLARYGSYVRSTNEMSGLGTRAYLHIGNVNRPPSRIHGPAFARVHGFAEAPSQDRHLLILAHRNYFGIWALLGTGPGAGPPPGFSGPGPPMQISTSRTGISTSTS